MYKGQLIAGLVIHTCLLMSFSVLLSYLRDKSSSLIPPSIAHGVFNALIFTQSANIFSHTSHVVEGALWALFFALIAVFISLKLIRAGHMENLK
jgi:membrane protease YdiL (CAAX protease family)